MALLVSEPEEHNILNQQEQGYVDPGSESPGGGPAPGSTAAIHLGHSNTQVDTPILIDACAFTLHGIDPVEDAYWLVGFDGWEELPHGKLGYKRFQKRGAVSLYSDGQEALGVHVSAMGAGCRQLEAELHIKDWYHFINAILKAQGHFSRLDIAFDDKQGILDLNRILDDTRAGKCISPMKAGRAVEGFSLSSGNTTGLTIYYGAPPSDIQIRIYDKAAEQKAEGHWVRVEIQFRHHRAQEVAENIAKNESTKWLPALLYNLLDFREIKDRHHSSRAKTFSYWLSFINTMEKYRIQRQPKFRTCDEVKKWFHKSMAPTLAMLVEADGGDLSSIERMASEGRHRYKEKHRNMLKVHEIEMAKRSNEQE